MFSTREKSRLHWHILALHTGVTSTGVFENTGEHLFVRDLLFESSARSLALGIFGLHSFVVLRLEASSGVRQPVGSLASNLSFGIFCLGSSAWHWSGSQNLETSGRFRQQAGSFDWKFPFGISGWESSLGILGILRLEKTTGRLRRLAGIFAWNLSSGNVWPTLS